MKKAGLTFVMPFGKYKGKTLRTIIEKDSKYAMWLIDNNVLEQGVTDEVFEYAYIDDNDLENPDSDFYKNDNFPSYEDY